MTKFNKVTLCSATLGEDGKAEPPIGPLYIASVFENNDIEVDFRDYQLIEGADAYSSTKLDSFLNNHAEVIGFSCFVDMLPLVIATSRLIFDRNPDVKIILGGPGPTASARRILSEYYWIYAVVKGEGEETIAEWIQAELEGSQDLVIAGMVRRSGSKLLEGEARKRIKEIDSIALPAYHLIDWSKYTHARIITTRGCSYQCSFCDVTALWGNKSIYRSLESVLQEIELLRDKYGKHHIAIIDDTFVLNRKRVTEFCNLLLTRETGIEWGCFGRINLMKPELVDIMARSGCKAVFYGIDSGSQYILNQTVKRVHAEDILPVLKYSANTFDKIEASFIWGYPIESFDDFEATLNLAGEASFLAPVVNVQMHMLSPLPMSPIYKNFTGVVVPPDKEDKDWLLLPSLLLDQRADEISKYVRLAPDIYPGFYTFPTPAKQRKRSLLQQCMSSLDRTIGSTLFNESTEKLLQCDDRTIEERLLSDATDSAERIGVGLALGLFRRARRRANSTTTVSDRTGAGIVRQRNDAREKRIA